MQEVFVRLSKQTHLPNDPIAWLVRVTRNEAITKWRSENRRRSHEQKHASERTQWFIANSEADDAPNSDELQNALIQLEPECREIVIAHIWGRLTFRQIAEAFDTSTSSTHRQYLAGIERLKELLGART